MFVVIDTNVLVSAFWKSDSNPATIVNLMLHGKLIPCYNSDILLEYSEVLKRKKLAFSLDKTNWILEKIIVLGNKIEIEYSDFQMIDESDRKFYDVAKKCGAFLITGNKKHFPNESFIFSPAEFLTTRNENGNGLHAYV
jgi:putative PIN family toxin of toxin-antitoxin system